jgi:SAM-dependent methyltransferase
MFVVGALLRCGRARFRAKREEAARSSSESPRRRRRAVADDKQITHNNILMKRFYDKNNERLVFVEQGATPDFWDELWGDDFEKEVKAVSDDALVVRTTKRFLPPPAKVLEGGCGRGQYVYALKRNGYDAYGIDYAKETVERINKSFPDLKVYLGDVRKLAFSDGEFDGYWSLGVIEHFYDGYEEIAKEMARVIKSGGHLFLVFPAFSPYRRLKAFFGLYPKLNEVSLDKSSFYQFALHRKRVVANLETLGFELLMAKHTNGFKTIKEESCLSPLTKVPVLSRLIKRLVNPLSFFFGHTVLLVLKKKEDAME